jgi:hypothetical protein
MTRHRFRIVLGTFLLFLATFPLLTLYRLPALHGLVMATTTFFLLSGIYAASGRRLLRWTATIVIVPAILLKWLEVLFPAWTLPLTGECFQLGASLFIIFLLVSFALHRGRVDAERIAAAVSAYLLIGLIWRDLYLLIHYLIPGSFNHATLNATQMLYFSYITLSTLGYGDILPVSGPAQALAFTEAIVGQLYLAILVARLVGLHIAYAEPDADQARARCERDAAPGANRPRASDNPT